MAIHRRGVAANPLFVSVALAIGLVVWAMPLTAKVDPGPPGSGGGQCQEAAVDRTSSAEDLRSLADVCRANPLVAIKALGKLNALPLPNGPRIVQRASTVPSRTVREQAQLEATVYFGTSETYPKEDGFEALAQLITTVNSTEAVIQSVAILGGVDSAEADTSLARDLARGRAEVLHRYVLAAGIPRGIVRVAIRPTVDGPLTSPKAADRLGRLVLIVERPLPDNPGDDRKRSAKSK